MLRSKRDVDKHVQDVLKKVGNENERKMLGFSFAKLYSQIGEFKLAKQYLSSYLSVKESSAPGHRLAGQIAEALGDKEGAVRSYRKSYDLDSSQRDLVLKICHLLCEFPPNQSSRDLQQFWLERAEEIQPHHSVVFELKQRLLLSSKQDGKSELEDLHSSEMLMKPSDMNLRIHLLKLYLESNRIKEAFEHVVKIESRQPFYNELNWYGCLLDVLEAYRKSDAAELTEDFHLSFLNAIERYSFLKILKIGLSNKSAQIIGDFSSTLLRFDNSIKLASSMNVKKDVLAHFARQLMFQMGLVLLCKRQAGLEDEHQALRYASTLFAIAYQHESISIPGKSSNRKPLVDSWNISAMYRKSQCGHCLVAWENRDGRKWTVDTVRKLNTVEGKVRIFEAVFGSVSSSSLFTPTLDLSSPPADIPFFADLITVDRMALQLYYSNLHQVIWLASRYFAIQREGSETDFAVDLSKILSDLSFIKDIPFSSSTWATSAPETLSRLDIEAFIYAVTYCVESQDDQIECRSFTFPAPLAKSPCSEQQVAWWQATLKLVSGSAKENLSELRRTLQRGLEVIRLSASNHGVSLELVARLAQTFAARAGQGRVFPPVDVPSPISTDTITVAETEALETQAFRYWKSFLEMESIGNRFTPLATGRLFEYRGGDVDVDGLANEAKVYVGFYSWRNGKKDDAIRYLQNASGPFASYYLALIYRELAEEELRKGPVFESRSAANLLLTRSRDALYVTLDRLRSPGMEKCHALDQKLADLIEIVETKITNLTSTSIANGHSVVEEEEDDREFVTPQQITSTPFRRIAPMSMMKNKSIRAEARPSPERLDAQIRQIVHRQEEFSQSIGLELKQIRSEVVEIKSLIQKLEAYLETQAKLEAKAKVKKGVTKFADAYDEYDYDEEEEEWQEGEEEEAELEVQTKSRGKVKPSAIQPQANLPLYPPPFPPTPTRSVYGMLPTFQPSGYQYSGYGGYMGVPPNVHPQTAYQLPPPFAYGTGVNHWEMKSDIQTPGMMTSVFPTPSTLMAPVTTAAGSVFSRLGVKAPCTITTASVQQPVLTTGALPCTADTFKAIIPGSISSAPHAYQISLPSTYSPEKVVDTSLVPAIPLTTQGLLASIPEPKYSSVTTPDKGSVKITPVKPPRDRKASSCSEGSYVADEEEQDVYPDFKPIIPLPEEVEVLTGEEDEEELFNQRAKLFRFVDNEWKERGVGQLKILCHQQSGKVRLLMRREQVLKVCANHSITPDIKLTEMKNTKNAWLWAAPDFADGEKKFEKFCVRFKTSDQATEFQKAFEKAKSLASSPKSSETSSIAVSEAKSKGWGEAFAPKAGSWTCNNCYINNAPSATKCVACEAVKPGAVVVSSSTTTTQFKFGVPQVTTTAPTTIGQATETTSRTASSLQPSAFAATSTSAPFKFGMPATVASVVSVGTTVAAPAFNFTPATTAVAITAPTAFSFTSATTTVAATAPTAFSFTPTTAIRTTPSFSAPTSTSAQTSFSFTPTTTKSTASSLTSTAVTSSATSTQNLLFGTPKSVSFSFTLPSSATTTPATTTKPFTFTPPKFIPSITTTIATTTIATTTTSGSATVAVTQPSTFPGFGTPKTGTDGKVTFGGFTFSGTPVFGSTKESDKPKPEEKKIEPKPSLFAGFSFQPSLAQKTDTADKKQETGMLFSLLSQQVPNKPFAIDTNKEFSGTGTKLFSSPEKKDTGAKEATNEDEEGEENKTEEYEPNVTFEPAVPLPELVQVTTGEEEEEVLFCDRGFLYRYVSESKEWKERGRGDMKLLKHKKTGRVRLLMRREQVHKICCNHHITKQITLKPLQTSDRTWTWFANDFSEGELVQETFALKFKTSEQAQKFKKAVEDAQAKLDVQTDAVEEKEVQQVTSVEPLSELFKPKEGSWECSGCLVRNSADVIKCPACETLKPGAQAPQTTTKTNVTTTATSAFKFGTEGGFKFGIPTTTTLKTASVFGSTATTSILGGPGFTGFNFSMPIPKPDSPARPRTKSGQSPHVSFSSDNEFYEEEEGDHIYFEPVVPLPDKIDVKTGEEDEDVLYCHRAKLLRFADGEWKERGTGDIKILLHRKSNKIRLLMRREQVLKICLNHLLTPDVKFVSKDERSWLWVAQDFSEGEARPETFVVRFRNAEIAKEFMDAVQRAQSGSPVAKPVISQGADDVQLVYEKKASPEDQRRAAELKLPPNFFLYKLAPPCPGCRGCENESNESGTNQIISKPVNEMKLKTEIDPKLKTQRDIKAIGASSPFGNTSSSFPSFSALAAEGVTGFKKGGTFAWSGTGDPVFRTTSKAKEDAEDDGDEVPESNDPHFEPVIPLPDQVEVKTGEEDEIAVFQHRAKLYRYESKTKEWKERGVGDMKILHNPEKNTYRILLRRDQIHKLACNHWLLPDMEINPLSTATNAWCWLAMDFSQGELVPENFAVRFKLDETAKLFQKTFIECRDALSKRRHDNKSASTVDQQDRQNMPTERSNLDDGIQSDTSEEAEEEDLDEEDEYVDAEETILFEDKCTLSSLEQASWVLIGTGFLKIIYDDDMLCARIVVKKDGTEDCICDTVIAIETVLKVDGKDGVWSAVDYSKEEHVRRTFLAQFSSEKAALDFRQIFAEGKQYAEKSDVRDEPSPEADSSHTQDEDHDYDEGKFSDS